MLYGNIFDIQRCSFHDGPGIRTTVFLKGCPLSCKWCHNPESLSPSPQLLLSLDKCIGCGRCETICEDAAQIMAPSRGIDYSRCRACGKCVEVCPMDALEIKGKPMSVDEIISEVCKDRIYYETSGGGLTISGGEPLLQHEFTLSLLKAAHKNGISTCIETSGLASNEIFKAVLAEVDVLLFDYKATNPDTHKELTGVSNALILENLAYAASTGVDIYLRCPLIQGVNDTPDHLDGIKAIKELYPQLKDIEIMPYHNLGNTKYHRLGQTPTFEALPNASEDDQKRWHDYLGF